MQKFHLFYFFALLTLGLTLGSGGAFRAAAQQPARFQTVYQAIPTVPGERRFATAEMQAIDAAGNLYGIIQYRGDFSMGPIGVTGADTAQHQFLVKMAPDGRALWTSTLTSAWPYCSYQVKLNPAGEVFLSGLYIDNITFSGLAGTTTLNSASGARDYYVAKWSPTGFLQWARNGGGQGWRFMSDMTADDQGNCYVTGSYWDASQFGNVVLTPLFLRWGSGNTFCLKYSASGNLDWVRDGARQDSLSSSRSAVIRTDHAGRLFLAGFTGGNVRWGNQALPVPPNGGAHIYWLRLDPATGQIIRAIGLPAGQGWDLSMDVDAAGFTYLLTDYLQTVTVSGVTLTDPANGNAAAFLARFDPDGALQWIRNLTSSAGFMKAYGVTADGQGKVYAMGTTMGPLLVDGVASVPGVAPRRDINGYILALDQTYGTPQWGLPVGGPTIKFVMRASVNDRGEVLAQISSQQDSVRLGGLLVNSDLSRSFGVRIVQQYNIIRGSVFVDADRDGLRSSAESPYAYGAVLQTVPAGQYFTSAADGRYDALVYLGASAVTMPNPPPYYTALAAGITAPASFSSYGNAAGGRDFALQPLAGQQDLVVHVTPVSRARPGFVVRYRVTYTNPGTVALPTGTLRLTYDPLLTYLSTTLPGGAQTGNVLTGNFTNLQPGQTRTFDVLFQLATTAPLGTVLQATADIGPLTGDLTPADNTETSRLTVTGSFDPNDIMVNHASLTAAQVASGEWLEYTIRFRNLGTDTAFTVLLRDSLPTALLNLSTLQLLSVSHSCQWGLRPGGVLTVSFTSAKLPPYRTNTIAADGFVRFRVRPAAALVPGDQVPNRAEIHFDYNAPIVTNTALTAINQPTGLPGDGNSNPNAADLAVWPNPATGALHVEARAPEAGPFTLTLLDALGRPVLTQTAPAASGTTRRTATLDLSGLPTGLYVLQGQGAGTAFTRRVVVR